MTVINNQLVQVGGERDGHKSRMVGMFIAESRWWIHPFPEMTTARSQCSAVAFGKWLFVAGGWGGNGEMLSSVEVLNTAIMQWHAGPPTPTPWYSMKSALVGDKCYFMGGYTRESGFYPTANDKMYNASFEELTEKTRKQVQIWKVTTQMPMTVSTPLSFHGSLLAVGGKNKSIIPTPTTAIQGGRLANSKVQLCVRVCRE